jgi:hypothetical protein
MAVKRESRSIPDPYGDHALARLGCSYTGSVERLQELYEDLWNRWREAFGTLDDHASGSGERVVYANAPLFDLKNYTPQKFPAGGRMLRNLPEMASSHYVYWLDSEGRPVDMACRHVVNNIDWQGFYSYTADEVEYVEFCRQTKVVSEYARITLDNGLPVIFQHIDINGGGSHLGGRTGRSAINYISQDSYHYWIQVEEYEASDHRIVSGKALVEGGRLSPQQSSLEYSYSDAGKLQRIVRIHEDGSKTTEFAARSKSGMSGLATKLSERIAARTIEALKEAGLGAPLLAVELSYRSVTNYLPIVIPATEQDSIPNLVLPTAIDSKNWISLNAEEFEPEMAEFVESFIAAERWDLGPKMLRQAALTVTKCAPALLTTTDGFVAFAIDWEFEGHELPAILKQCGASAATLKKLKSIGWLK